MHFCPIGKLKEVRIKDQILQFIREEVPAKASAISAIEPVSSSDSDSSGRDSNLPLPLPPVEHFNTFAFWF